MVLAALPFVLTLAYFGLGFALKDPVSSPVYLFLLVAWNAIPFMWPVSIVVGIVTVAFKRLGRWRITGIVAIVLPVLEFVYVVWFISQLVI